MSASGGTATGANARPNGITRVTSANNMANSRPPRPQPQAPMIPYQQQQQWTANAQRTNNTIAPAPPPPPPPPAASAPAVGPGSGVGGAPLSSPTHHQRRSMSSRPNPLQRPPPAPTRVAANTNGSDAPSAAAAVSAQSSSTSHPISPTEGYRKRKGVHTALADDIALTTHMTPQHKPMPHAANSCRERIWRMIQPVIPHFIQRAFVDRKKTDDREPFRTPLHKGMAHTTLCSRLTLCLLALIAVALVLVFTLGADAHVYSTVRFLRGAVWSDGQSSATYYNRSDANPIYTIISLLHDMNDELMQTDNKTFVFQTNAIVSWLQLVAPDHVLIYVDTQASCDYIRSRPEFHGVMCFPVPCMNAQYKRPELNCIFSHANSNAKTNIIAFVNGDIILSPYIRTVLESGQEQFDKMTLVSRRTDTTLTYDQINTYLATEDKRENVKSVMEFCASNGTMHSEFGIDLFVYNRKFFETFNFPPFLAGVYRWDNWLLATLLMRQVTVIDASTPGLVVHQQLAGGSGNHKTRNGSVYNDALCKSLIGDKYRIGNIGNANTMIVGTCPNCKFVPNRNFSVHVHLILHAHPAQWINVITVRTGQEFEVNNAVCYYEKIKLQHFIFLAKDATMYEYLYSRKLPVIYAGGVPAPGQPPYTLSEALIHEHELLHEILKLKYSFVLLDVATLLLADPIDHVVSADVDVHVKKAQDNIMSSAIYAVSPSTQGQYYWNQVKSCRLANIARPSYNWTDCVTFQYNKLRGALKKGVFDQFLFPDINSALIDRFPQMNGFFPIAVVANETMQTARTRELYRTFGLIAVSETPDAKCRYVTPLLLKSPTDKIEAEFTLKIRVITFSRYESLVRLLTSLNEANYDGDDKIELEISIDYPGNFSDTETINNWTRTQLESRSFTWKHGTATVIQQAEHKGLVGQWTTAWKPANNKEIMLFLEDDTAVSKEYYLWVKKMIQTYYLDPDNYDPRMYGFALQLQHTILGETWKERYGSRNVSTLVGNSTFLFRYQLVGTWGGVFFPQHWTEFLVWLREKQFNPPTGQSAIGFQPCVPSLLSNDWWRRNPHRVWSQWFVRFAFEKGWYNVYTNFPNKESLVGNYREGGENFHITKGLMNQIVQTMTSEMMYTPKLSTLPLYDFHFRKIAQPYILSVRNSIMTNGGNFTDCWTMDEYRSYKKAVEEDAKRAEEKRLLKEENKRRVSAGLPPLSSLAQLKPKADANAANAALQAQARAAEAANAAAQKAAEEKAAAAAAAAAEAAAKKDIDDAAAKAAADQVNAAEQDTETKTAEEPVAPAAEELPAADVTPAEEAKEEEAPAVAPVE